MYVDGEWIEATAGAYIDVLDPATAERIARVPDADADDVGRAVRSAHTLSKSVAGLVFRNGSERRCCFAPLTC